MMLRLVTRVLIIMTHLIKLKFEPQNHHGKTLGGQLREVP